MAWIASAFGTAFFGALGANELVPPKPENGFVGMPNFVLIYAYFGVAFVMGFLFVYTTVYMVLVSELEFEMDGIRVRHLGRRLRLRWSEVVTWDFGPYQAPRSGRRGRRNGPPYDYGFRAYPMQGTSAAVKGRGGPLWNRRGGFWKIGSPAYLNTTRMDIEDALMSVASEKRGPDRF